MMQKMGWKGSGLGSGESGIVEPVEVINHHKTFAENVFLRLK